MSQQNDQKFIGSELTRQSRRSFLKLTAFGLGGIIASPSLRALAAAGRGNAEISIGTTYEPSSFDGYHYTISNYVHQRQLYDHLVDYDYDLKVSPRAVTSWKVAPDNMSADLELRSDISLHSGRNWVPEDLLQGFDRAASGPDGQQLNGPMAPISSWTKSSERTIHLEFKEPISEAILTDILVTFPVTDRDMNTIEQSVSTPSGSGPYRLASRVPNDSFVLERFAEYWQPGLPPIKKITVRVFRSEEAMISALLSGAIQGADFFPGRAVGRLGDRFGVHEGYEGALGRILRHNVKTGAMASQQLRQAMFRCIDRERIAREVYHGFATPTYLPWVGTSVAHDDTYASKFSYDLNAAKQLIDASGVKSASVMVPSNDAPGLREAQIIQADMAKVGFDLKIDPTEQASISARYQEGKYETFLSNIGNIGKRSPSAVTTNSFMRTTTKNAIWGEDIMPEYVDAMAKIRTAPNSEVEKAGSDDVNAIMADKAWFVTYVHLKSLFAHDKGLSDNYRDTDDRLDLTHAGYEA